MNRNILRYLQYSNISDSMTLFFIKSLKNHWSRNKKLIMSLNEFFNNALFHSEIERIDKESDAV